MEPFLGQWTGAGAKWLPPTRFLQCSSKSELIRHFTNLCLAYQRLTPLIATPLFHMDMIQLDWLHIMDVGVSLHWLGSVFTILMDKLPGASKDARCKVLRQRMKQYYQEHAGDSKLPILKTSMLVKDKAKSKGIATFPKLRAKAGESKGLILFGLLQRRDLHSVEDPVESSVLQCAEQIHICCQHLSKQVFEGHAWSYLEVFLHVCSTAYGGVCSRSLQNCTSFWR